MWFWIWFVLVLAGTGVLLWLLWRLWQRATAFGRAVERFTAAADRLQSDGADRWSAARPVVALGQVATARQYRDERVVARFARRGSRLRRNLATWARWESFNR